jgi:hypothetical protein
MYKLSPVQLELIAQLPEEVAAMAATYPVDIYNAAEYWNEPDFPAGYQPVLIEIYYDDEVDGPDIFFLNGELLTFRLREPGIKPTSIAVEIDDQWAYIQLEGQIILDRIGGVILPDILINPGAAVSEFILELGARGWGLGARDKKEKEEKSD